MEKKAIIILSIFLIMLLIIGNEYGVSIGIRTTKAALPVITADQSTDNSLIPDWSNVTHDFFTLVPGTVEPVLTYADVTDRSADFVADPFMFHENNTWYMFFEVGNYATGSEIGLATSNDGFSWTYQQIVLSEHGGSNPFDLAYPYVFKWDGTYYLIPETYSQDQVRLYQATNFPYSWTFDTVLISGADYGFIPVDSSIFRYNNMWWMFTGDDSSLYLFYSSNLTDPASWHMTANSPIVANDPSGVRGGGRTIVFDNGTIIRLTQEGNVSYGAAVRAFEVDTLTETSFAEHEVSGSPIVQAAGGDGWNSLAMHTVDPWYSGNSWIAVVDGGDASRWSIGIYVTPLQAAVISPTNVSLDLGQSQMFSSSPVGGKPPYSYQWYLNDTAVNGATNQNWTFTPGATGHYKVYVSITDALSTTVQSDIVTDITVYPQLTTGKADLVVRGQDGSIYYQTYNISTASWSGWSSLPSGTTLDSPAAAFADKLYFVVRGADGSSLWFSSLNQSDSTFSGWSLIDGSTQSAPVLTSNGTALALVVRGEDNSIYYRIYGIASRTWTAWFALPSGTTIDSPSAAYVGNILHIVVKGTDGNTLWYSNINPGTGAFSGWSWISGFTPSSPTLTSNDTVLELVVRGGDNCIYYRDYALGSHTWINWNALSSGTTLQSPAATILQNKLFITVIGSDSISLWQSSIDQTTNTFSGWTPLSGSTPSKPTMTG